MRITDLLVGVPLTLTRTPGSRMFCTHTAGEVRAGEMLRLYFGAEMPPFDSGKPAVGCGQVPRGCPHSRQITRTSQATSDSLGSKHNCGKTDVRRAQTAERRELPLMATPETPRRHECLYRMKPGLPLPAHSLGGPRQSSSPPNTPRRVTVAPLAPPALG